MLGACLARQSGFAAFSRVLAHQSGGLGIEVLRGLDGPRDAVKEARQVVLIQFFELSDDLPVLGNGFSSGWLL